MFGDGAGAALDASGGGTNAETTITGTVIFIIEAVAGSSKFRPGCFRALRSVSRDTIYSS
jgi:hypothetical protein